MTDRRWFALGVAVLWALLFVQAIQTPVLLDDWYQLTWYRSHDLSLASIWAYAHYNYFHFNPRVGDVFLMVLNGPRIIHLIVTPLVEIALLWLAFAIAFARWPKMTKRDLQLLLVLQVLIWIITPIPGIIYFYRPFCTNYLFAFATTLALFVPYRLALAHEVPKQRLYMIPVMFVVGWLAGMSNEHTGPTAMVAMLAFVIWAWRTKRLRAWMISGFVGLYIGYPMLFFAPGQAERYAGVANRLTPLKLLKQRGITGCFDIILDFVGEAQLGTSLFVAGILIYFVSRRRRSEAAEPLPQQTLVAALLLVVASGMIVMTLFCSPTIGERLLFGSSVLLAGVYASVFGHLFADRTTRRVIVSACAVLFAYHAWRYIDVYHDVIEQNDDRLAQLAATPKNTVAVVPPYEHRHRTRWYWGDDFRYASLREYVANEVYDLTDIKFDRPLGWAQPNSGDHYSVRRTFDPPLSPEEDAKLEPRYIPTYWEWAVVQMRRALVFGPLNVPGHKLVRYAVESRDLGFVDPKHRPVQVFVWTPTSLKFVDSNAHDDELGRQFIRLWNDNIPENITDVYVISCTGQRKVIMLPDPNDIGPLIPIDANCRGITTAVVCQTDVCWLAGRYWQ
ncbi:hypothetical protein BH11MYX2_BH11MYX2_03500 [soil metagenome]